MDWVSKERIHLKIRELWSVDRHRDSCPRILRDMILISKPGNEMNEYM